jgi:GTP cyclohydrolase III
MPRSCPCERLLARLDADVRLRTLPAAAQMLWVKLMRAALASPEVGVLRVGTETRFAMLVSIAVSVWETDVETHLETLRNRGLVETDEAAGVLRLTDAATEAAKTNAARINGLRGGRPRKGESPEDALRRRQGAFLMPLPKPTEPNVESSRARLSDSDSESQSGLSVPTPREETDVQALGNELAEIAGLDAVRGAFAFQDVRAWVAQGATAELLRRVVGEVTAKARAAGKVVGSMRYFAGAVREAMAAARAPRVVLASEAYGDLEMGAYHNAVLAWSQNGCAGERPDLRNYRRAVA